MWELAASLVESSYSKVLHQKIVLSSMFAIVMDELIRHIQDVAIWYKLFADEIRLVDETT